MLNIDDLVNRIIAAFNEPDALDSIEFNAYTYKPGTAPILGVSMISLKQSRAWCVLEEKINAVGLTWDHARLDYANYCTLMIRIRRADND